MTKVHSAAAVVSPEYVDSSKTLKNVSRPGAPESDDNDGDDDDVEVWPCCPGEGLE